MTMTDTVLFVKETRTCEYVLVIHTPRLCGEPGFKSRLEQMPEAAIRCREVVDDVESVDPSLPDAPFPYKRPSRQPIPSPQRPPAGAAEDGGNKDVTKDAMDRAQDTAKLLRKALESILRGGADVGVVVPQGEQGVQGEQGGEFFFTIDTDTQEVVMEDDDSEGETIASGQGTTIEEALRAAGFKIRGQKLSEEDEKEKQGQGRDEL